MPSSLLRKQLNQNNVTGCFRTTEIKQRKSWKFLTECILCRFAERIYKFKPLTKSGGLQGYLAVFWYKLPIDTGELNMVTISITKRTTGNEKTKRLQLKIPMLWWWCLNLWNWLLVNGRAQILFPLHSKPQSSFRLSPDFIQNGHVDQRQWSALVS